MDAQTEELRRFWSRVVFSVGMLWGFVPFIILPHSMIVTGSNVPPSHLVAEIFNRLTVFPASALAFWQRKFASLWLIADGAVILYAMVKQFPGAWPARAAALILIAIPLLLGGFGLLTAMREWPPLLERKKRDQGRTAVR